VWMIWRQTNADLAERCAKCGRPILGLKRTKLEAVRVFHPECLPISRKPRR